MLQLKLDILFLMLYVLWLAAGPRPKKSKVRLGLVSGRSGPLERRRVTGDFGDLADATTERAIAA